MSGQFDKQGKLSSRYIMPFELLERVGTVAYQLALPPNLLSVVEYIKVQHLYRILIHPACVLLSFCVRIGAFDRFPRFCACVGFSSSVHIFVGVRVKRTNVEKPG